MTVGVEIPESAHHVGVRIALLALERVDQRLGLSGIDVDPPESSPIRSDAEVRYSIGVDVAEGAKAHAKCIDVRGAREREERRARRTGVCIDASRSANGQRGLGCQPVSYVVA